MSSNANEHDSTNPTKLWKDWNETTASMWPGILNSEKEAYRNPFSLYHLWLKSVGTTHEQLKTNSSRIIDPMEMWKQWSNATVDVWNTTVEAYTSTLRAFYNINDAMLQNIQIPTNSDMAQVAAFVAALEERVYTLEDAFVNFEDDYLKANTDQMLEDLTGRLKRVEDKLDILLEKIATRA